MYDKVALALLATGGTSGFGRPIDEIEVRIHADYVFGVETDVPPELSVPLEDLGTGDIAVDEPVPVLVRDAARYVQAIAVLPTSRDDEDLIDRYLASRVDEPPSELL
ncbi:MAG: hypothetical protein EA397_16105 [Deltaproteobacteria bacterium]|nr:MAG: hypothetical protein EA397_16105 [Deltaproteobacteria bacterium]